MGDAKMVGQRLGKLWTGLWGSLLALGLILVASAPVAAADASVAAAPGAAASANPQASPAASSGTVIAVEGGAGASPTATPASAGATAVGYELPPGYVDNSTCIRCHKVEGKDFPKTMMGHLMMRNPRDEQERLGCQGCHGAGRDHMRHPHKPSPGFLSFRETSLELVKVENDRCLECHENGPRAFWRASTHAFRSVRCVDCHTVMCPVTVSEEPSPQVRKSPLTVNFVNPFVVTRNETQVCLRCHLRKKMEINLPSHMPLREGLMVCTDCHNPHGGPYPHQLRAATVNEVCYRCHAEKRGPFLWLHAPVIMNCLNCHNPHGSINQHLLQIREPLLCQRCHIGTFHPSSPKAPGFSTVFLVGQSCTHCHSQIHGSNSPGGRVFTR
jgi:predicted CXXCH cytochrome family protein